jgi:hypothetical protein
MSNGTMTAKGYRPEVRTSYHKPSMISGQIVDAEWRPMQTTSRPDSLGVPTGYFDRKLVEHGLLSLPQAEALRWWFICNAEAERPTGALCLETRLQEYMLTISHKVEAGQTVNALDCRGHPLLVAANPEQETTK